MKWTFIVPPVLCGNREIERVFGCTYGLYPIPNIFMLYCASVVRKTDQPVSYIDAPILKWKEKDFTKYIQNSSSNAYIFYTVNLAKETDLKALKIIRSCKPNSWVIFLGPSPTYEPNDYLTDDKIIVVRGEMEATLYFLAKIFGTGKDVDCETLSSCNGISYRLNGELKHNPNREIISDIDNLPFPARDLIDKSKYFNPKLGVRPFTPILTSRGCSFRCRYCVPNSLSFARELEYRKGVSGWSKPKVSVRSYENVYEELLWLKRNGYQGVSILDDQFIWRKDREIKIAEAMGKLGIKWGCLSRGEMITEDIAHAFSENNCRYVDIGVESFCQEILDDIKKGTTVEKLYKGIMLLKRYNVPVKLNVLFGASPLETKYTIKQTMSVIKSLDVESIMVGICNPFPGTEFWDIAKRNNWLLTSEYTPVDVQKESTVEYPNLSKDELEKAVRKTNLRFFLNPKFILKNISKVTNPSIFLKSAHSLFKKLTKPK